MSTLYLEHFGFARDPFNVTPDPSLLYESLAHKEALAQLVYGVQARKGFVVLTGEVGTGKTTLVHALLNQLKGNAQSAFIFNRIDDSEDLLRYVCEDFGLLDSQQGQRKNHDYVTLLNRFLLECYRKGENCALIIDEAQNLTPEVLESIRMLSNFETAQDKLLQILLVGQPELATRLNSPGLRQLKQRVAMRYHLRPLSLSESKQYIAARVQRAGGSPSIFAEKVLESIFFYSSGVPRLINILCDNSLLTTYALGKREVEAGAVREVATDLQLERRTLVPEQASSVLRVPAETHSERSRGTNGTDGQKGSGASLAVQGVPEERSTASSESRRTPDVVPQNFLNRVAVAFTDAVGPMGPIVMRDQIAQLGESMVTFPRTRLDELFKLMTGEILAESLKAGFQRKVSNEIHSLHGTQVR